MADVVAESGGVAMLKKEEKKEKKEKKKKSLERGDPMNSFGREEARNAVGLLAPEQASVFPGVSSPEDLVEQMKRRPDWVLANMAHLAYRKPVTITERCTAMGAEDVRVRKKQQAVGFVAKFPTFVVLAFRGTVSKAEATVPRQVQAAVGKLKPVFRFKDVPTSVSRLVLDSVMADLNFVKTVVEGVKVHKGFAGELLRIWPSLCDDLHELSGDLPVYATGHSLGGAMATLSALFYKFDRLVTFGEPRTGHRLSKALRVPPERHIRYVNGCDPVPDLPPSFLLFEHHGLLRLLHHPLGPGGLVDHSIVGYVDLLSKKTTFPTIYTGAELCGLDEKTMKSIQDREVRRSMLEAIFGERESMADVEWEQERIVCRFRAKLLRRSSPNEEWVAKRNIVGSVYATPHFIFFTNATLQPSSMNVARSVVRRFKGGVKDKSFYTRASTPPMDVAIPFDTITDVSPLFRHHSVDKSCFSIVTEVGGERREICFSIVWKHAENGHIVSKLTNIAQPANARAAVAYLWRYPPLRLEVACPPPPLPACMQLQHLPRRYSELFGFVWGIQELLLNLEDIVRDDMHPTSSVTAARTRRNLALADGLTQLIDKLIVPRESVLDDEIILSSLITWAGGYVEPGVEEQEELREVESSKVRVPVLLYGDKVQLAVATFTADHLAFHVRHPDGREEHKPKLDLPYSELTEVLIHWKELLVVCSAGKKKSVKFYVSNDHQLANELCLRAGADLLRAHPSQTDFPVDVHDIRYVPFICATKTGGTFSCAMLEDPRKAILAEEAADSLGRARAALSTAFRCLQADMALLQSQISVQRRVCVASVVTPWAVETQYT